MGQMCGGSRTSSEVRGPPSLAELVGNSLLCRYVDGSVKCSQSVCSLECIMPSSIPSTRKKFPRHIEPGMVAPGCHCGTQEAEAGF